MQVGRVCLSQMYMIYDDVTCTHDDVTQGVLEGSIHDGWGNFKNRSLILYSYVKRPISRSDIGILILCP